jgi:hypothetical protein
MCRLDGKGLGAWHIRNGVSLLGYLFRMEHRAVIVSVQALRAELLWVEAGVRHEDQGLWAWAPRASFAQKAKSISATRFITFSTVSTAHVMAFRVLMWILSVVFLWGNMDAARGKSTLANAGLASVTDGCTELAELDGNWELIGGYGRNGGWNDARGHNRVRALALYKDALYAGLGAADAEVWKLEDGRWMQVGGGRILESWEGRLESLDSAEQVWVNSLLVDPEGDHLYAGLEQAEGGAQLWRFDGERWAQIGGTGDNETGDWDSWAYKNVYTLVWHDGALYAGLQGKLPGSTSQDYREGFSNGEIYRFDGTSWERVSGDGIRGGWDRDHGTTWIYKLIVFRGELHAAIGLHGVRDLRWTGEVWRLSGGERWEHLGGEGARGSWDLPSTNLVTSMTIFHDKLFIGYNCQACSQPDGRVGNVWCWDGESWHDLALPFFGTEPSLAEEQRSSNDFAVYRGWLVAGGGRAEPSGHLAVWALDINKGGWRCIGASAMMAELQPADAAIWQRNQYVYSMTVYRGDLIVGFRGDDNTGHVWRFRMNDQAHTRGSMAE